MPQIEITARFAAFYRGLPSEVRRKVDKAIALLAENPPHPSLQASPVKGAPIQGTHGISEARLDLNHRLTYERLAGDVLLLRAVGRHDETIQKP